MRSTRREGVHDEGHWLCTYGWDKDCGYTVTSHSVEMGVVCNAVLDTNSQWINSYQYHMVANNSATSSHGHAATVSFEMVTDCAPVSNNVGHIN